MGLAVTTVAAGGLPVRDLNGPGGIAVTEVTKGIAITKVTVGGLGVSFVSATGGAVATTFTTFDLASVTNVALTNGNLTATHTNATTNSGARSITQKNSGKYYFEITLTTIAASDCLGIVTPAGTYTSVVTTGNNGAYVYGLAGAVWAGGANTGLSIGAFANGNVIGVAVDLDNDKIWFRKSPAGNWNGQVIGSQDPANNIGGGNISGLSATTVAPVSGFGIVANSAMTANFGALAFTGAVPSGFTSGWPA